MASFEITTEMILFNMYKNPAFFMMEVEFGKTIMDICIEEGDSEKIYAFRGLGYGLPIIIKEKFEIIINNICEKLHCSFHEYILRKKEFFINLEQFNTFYRRALNKNPSNEVLEALRYLAKSGFEATTNKLLESSSTNLHNKDLIDFIGFFNINDNEELFSISLEYFISSLALNTHAVLFLRKMINMITNKYFWIVTHKIISHNIIQSDNIHVKIAAEFLLNQIELSMNNDELTIAKKYQEYVLRIFANVNDITGNGWLNKNHIEKRC